MSSTYTINMTLIELIHYQNTHTLFDIIFSITKEESANEVSVTNNKRDELLEKKENLRDSNVKVWCVCVCQLWVKFYYCCLM